MKTHYDSLGVSPTATKDEIKKAYRKLCMETHPDVASSSSVSSTAKTERFKQISEAYSVLSDDRARSRYNFEMDQAHRYGRPMHHYESNRHAHAYNYGFSDRAGRSPSTSFGIRILEGIYKPKNLFLGLTLGFASVSFINSQLKEADDPYEKIGVSKEVEAWKNPKTGLWQQPAPWDPLYQKMKPKLVKVPRSQVQPSFRP